MRELLTRQMPLMPVAVHRIQQDLRGYDRAIRELPVSVLQQVDEDLRRGHRADVGRSGMSAERVIRATVLRRRLEVGYRELAFLIDDSASYRAFIGLGPSETAPAVSTLQANIAAVSPKSLEAVLRAVICQGVERGLESGERVAVDATAVETNIHHPADSTLLADCVSTLTRLFKEARKLACFRFRDHTRRAKSRVFRIANAKSMRQRQPWYHDLLKTVHKSMTYGRAAVASLRQVRGEFEVQATRLRGHLERHLELADAIWDQTFRRVLLGEKLPPDRKLVSLHEPHTDIIKSKRGGDPVYGHKVFVARGASGLILDVMTPRGNPNDGTLTCKAIERVEQQTGIRPSEVAFDGAFGSRANFDELKGKGIDAVVFTSPRGLTFQEMAGSKKHFELLRRFRASIEGTIGWLKNTFGLRRCQDRGFRAFQAGCLAAAITHNLTILARSG